MKLAKAPKTDTPRIFISHAWEDKPLVRRLEQELKSAGAEVWVDHAGICGGDNLPERISKALNWCNTLLLIYRKQQPVHAGFCWNGPTPFHWTRTALGGRGLSISTMAIAITVTSAMSTPSVPCARDNHGVFGYLSHLIISNRTNASEHGEKSFCEREMKLLDLIMTNLV
ncbi:MAG: toll/interleukin-1 receptor domain-containing protein [candidate division KSB1 bacterium]|nr:toll/interleukin-1 receptor domain-containing protein [candidate division KSB1 bacterium]MDZ7311787.1 toll/interleukin-1 receptor domain-containing protein [candidate division KSB1 bacterium]